MWPFFTSLGGSAWLDEPRRAQYRAFWQQGLEGALNYYRGSPLKPPTSASDAIHGLSLPPALVTVRVPTTVLWGDADTALLPALLDGLAEFVTQLEVQRVPGASHWIVHEQPDLVVKIIARLLAPTPRRTGL